LGGSSTDAAPADAAPADAAVVDIVTVVNTLIVVD
jgi:hypothetical protein